VQPSRVISPAEIPARERLILALDVPGIDAARALVDELGDSVLFYKIGLELAMSGQYFELLDWLIDRGKRVFADLKFHDIPATVGAAVRQLSRSGASFLTVHAAPGVVAAAAETKGPDLKVLAVTVLTSVSAEDLADSGVRMSIEELALNRAQSAVAAGADGVVASALEAGQLRRTLGTAPLIVTPGIRPAGSAVSDQRRVATPASAIRAGADYLVVGRPIRSAGDPYRAASAIQAEIAEALE
jgi:orotidine-5'-phosphate decarboxylase